MTIARQIIFKIRVHSLDTGNLLVGLSLCHLKNFWLFVALGLVKVLILKANGFYIDFGVTSCFQELGSGASLLHHHTSHCCLLSIHKSYFFQSTKDFPTLTVWKALEMKDYSHISMRICLKVGKKRLHLLL